MVGSLLLKVRVCRELQKKERESFFEVVYENRARVDCHFFLVNAKEKKRVGSEI